MVSLYSKSIVSFFLYKTILCYLLNYLGFFIHKKHKYELKTHNVRIIHNLRRLKTKNKLEMEKFGLKNNRNEKKNSKI